MTTEKYEEKIDDLFERWKKARPDYREDVFTEDGICNYDEWLKAKPRILFLLKEQYDGWKITDGFGVSNTSFSKNIARWRQIIIEMYKNPDAIPDFDTIQLPAYFNDIAIVEFKKKNEGKGVSSMPEIKQYAERDHEFIKDEIDLIDPQVIICGNTAELYGDFVYGEYRWEMFCKIEDCELFKHGNRLIVSVYHPSTRSHEKERHLFETIVKMLKESEAFKKFNW